ncbi:hypothetical protein F0562_004158 [Nyssa sinensis]|uniref:Uncharacterized protein n=1 Tax=Nyssa sinensis TaxID=561372 RepID=A0A5J5BXT6_9ASTE|nr:hypothetical protein F0562_004158 [Nyssa sinensis]
MTRWSLIAGRLPGRTANDVKNYWNTHLQKKTVARGEEEIVSCTNSTPTSPLDVGGIPWWDDLLVDKEIDNGKSWSISGLEEQPTTGLWNCEETTLGEIAGNSSSVDEELLNGWSDLSIDVDLWDLLSNE